MVGKAAKGARLQVVRVCAAPENVRSVFGAFFDCFWSVFGVFALRPKTRGAFSERFAFGVGT